MNCGRFCFWRRQSAFFLYEICRERLNGFAPNSQGRRVWSLTRTSLKVKVKGQGRRGQKRHFSTLPAACVRFMFGETSLSSPLVIVYYFYYVIFINIIFSHFLLYIMVVIIVEYRWCVFSLAGGEKAFVISTVASCC